MATRNLTEPFVLMRNNALQTKHIYAEQNLSDRMALVNSDNRSPDSVELKGINGSNSSPPAWADALEETQYILSRLKIKLDKRQMEQLTREIGRAFSSGHRQVQTVKAAARHEIRHAEKQLAMSAVLALSSALQDLGIRYRTAQNNYIQQLNSREERNRPFFGEDRMLPDISMDSWAGESPSNEINDQFWQPRQQQKQETVLLMLEDAEESMRQAVEREQEVTHIVQSIADLNHIFKDLATMVHDQGSILDRIDYNIEHTQGQVHEGYQQLKKADSYQRANRKLYCIFILAAAIILLSFLFVLFKT
ncbi:Similar to Stx16: Syntaxin-16 (Mus musculus) [Cotesia congregata]|uniref:Similar to Stx16: Syntaxin-16 (Mus musculus) n=1 Tax=Cotesia congregata TaxID=51543 RepID=A0A8J2HR19_COTCN|nr:Similar to Stx16: Syntaxin-16 (Mus musculus) [Cotesia congregata]